MGEILCEFAIFSDQVFLLSMEFHHCLPMKAMYTFLDEIVTSRLDICSDNPGTFVVSFDGILSAERTYHTFLIDQRAIYWYE